MRCGRGVLCGGASSSGEALFVAKVVDVGGFLEGVVGHSNETVSVGCGISTEGAEKGDEFGDV